MTKMNNSMMVNATAMMNMLAANESRQEQSFLRKDMTGIQTLKIKRAAIEEATAKGYDGVKEVENCPHFIIEAEGFKPMKKAMTWQIKDEDAEGNLVMKDQKSAFVAVDCAKENWKLSWSAHSAMQLCEVIAKRDNKDFEEVFNTLVAEGIEVNDEIEVYIFDYRINAVRSTQQIYFRIDSWQVDMNDNSAEDVINKPIAWTNAEGHKFDEMKAILKSNNSWGATPADVSYTSIETVKAEEPKLTKNAEGKYVRK